MGIKPENYQKIRTHFIKLMGSKCAYCGSKEKLEFDHKYPSKISMPNMSRSKREWHWFDEYAKRNLQILCAHCNNTKNNSVPIYFTNTPGMI
jgi:5-methylcytosine-specific restriction endonuclease McrA